MDKFKVHYRHQDVEVEVAKEDLSKVLNQLMGERKGTVEVAGANTNLSIPASKPSVSSVSKKKAEAPAAAPVGEKKRPGRKAGTKLMKIDGKTVLVDPSKESKPVAEAVKSAPVEKKKGAVGRKKTVKQEIAPVVEEPVSAPKKRGRAKKVVETPIPVAVTPAPAKKEKSAPVSNIVEWNHNADRYGMPSSAWGKTDIALWFLYVAKANTGAPSFSRSQIAESVNKNFKPERRLREETLLKELSAFKRGKNVYVRETAPDKYALTEAGEKYVQGLIAQSIESM